MRGVEKRDRLDLIIKQGKYLLSHELQSAQQMGRGQECAAGRYNDRMKDSNLKSGGASFG